MNVKNINQKRLKKLLIDIIDIYSPSGKEIQIVDYIIRYLKHHNISHTPQLVNEGRHNVLIFPSSKKTPQTLFLGHIDTVTAYDYENYKSRVENDWIYGLGAADMKSGCAAMIEAFITYNENKNNKYPSVLALVVGEEETGDGAISLIEEYDFKWALIAEPTDLNPCICHYGYIETKIQISGERKHAAESEKDKHAINSMLKLLVKLTDFLDNEKKDIIYNIRDINSSQSGFAAPDWCSAFIDFHLPPKYPLGNFTIELEEEIKKFSVSNVKIEEILNFLTIYAGYDLPEKGFLVELLKKIFIKNKIDWEPCYFKSASDANILWRAGIKPIILGPGKLSYAHHQNEKVLFNDVVIASEIYYQLLNSLK